MIIAPLLGTALVVAVATAPSADPAAPPALSAQQRAAAAAATAPLVRSATACIVHTVIADPRYRKNTAATLGELIVQSMPACLTPVRAMIDAYDRSYGEGTGEAFFMGPYLDVLPGAVLAGAKDGQQDGASGAAKDARKDGSNAAE
jgi:hypothetical protein